MQEEIQVPPGYALIGELYGVKRPFLPCGDAGMLSDYTDELAGAIYKTLRQEMKESKESLKTRAATEAERQIHWALQSNNLAYMYDGRGCILSPVEQLHDAKERYTRFAKSIDALFRKHNARRYYMGNLWDRPLIGRASDN